MNLDQSNKFVRFYSFVFLFDKKATVSSEDETIRMEKKIGSAVVRVFSENDFFNRHRVEESLLVKLKKIGNTDISGLNLLQWYPIREEEFATFNEYAIADRVSDSISQEEFLYHFEIVSLTF